MGGAIAIPEVSTAEDQYLIDAIQGYLDQVKTLFAELAGEDEEDTEMKSILNDEVLLAGYLQKVRTEHDIHIPYNHHEDIRSLLILCNVSFFL